MSKTNKGNLPFQKFFIRGMHCAACEMIIEKRLRKESGVIFADANLKRGTLEIQTVPKCHISESYLNSLFKGDGYLFSANTGRKQLIPAQVEQVDGESIYTPYLVAGLFIIIFYFLQLSGFSSLISVNSQSSLPIFFFFGLLAGLSSCAALVGGIILSLSKQWQSTYSKDDSTLKKSEPHIVFNLGRVVGYGIFGGLLGLIGNFFRLSPTFSATLVIAVSILMILLGLQMLGVKALAKYQFRLPKFLTHKISNEENFQGRFGPFIMGALTFFLPCGFTITAQALALSSGSPLQGMLIMALFALGTVPGLLIIGIGSTKLFSNPSVSKQFSIVAGLLVLFFAGFNINSQLSVLGLSNIGDVLSTTTIQNSSKKDDTSLVPVVSGKQVIKFNASSAGYSPNRFKVRVGQPVRMEISDKGTSGCTNAVISKLWEGQVDLTPGKTSTKEFTPSKVGVYKFSCWMGMVTGTIEVVNESKNTGSVDTTLFKTAARDYGCGGGGTGSCGGAK